MKSKAARPSRVVSYRTKTKLAVERCEPRLALDASQVPESQPIDDGFLEVIQPAPTFTLNSNVGGRLSGPGGFANGGYIIYEDLFSESVSVDYLFVAPQTSARSAEVTAWLLMDDVSLWSDSRASSSTATDLGAARVVVPLDTASLFVYEGPSTSGQ